MKRTRRRKMPDPVADTPENVMQAKLNTPPKAPDEWRCLRDGGDG